MDIKTLRSHRFLGIALFDVIGSMIGLVLILLVFRRIFFPDLRPRNFCIAGVLLAIPVGILFHILFGTDTKLNYKLGLSSNPT
jgi:Ca2+/Na+ antiporter